MSALPMPGRFRSLLDLGQVLSNPSLLFDKGLDRYGDGWTLEAGVKQDFLAEFVKRFPGGKRKNYFASFRKRRSAALARIGAVEIPLVSHTPLAVGLGLASPLENGFQLDRLTGCPYLAGSSVKGALRAAARRIAQGQLEGDRDFWGSHLERLFGPPPGSDDARAQGCVAFFDAFPTAWPALRVDVLTPHYRGYYGEGAAGSDCATVPADWWDPVPIPFLTVAAGTEFTFPLSIVSESPTEGDLRRVRELLVTALDWLGIGSKRSSGYGAFFSEPYEAEAAAQARETQEWPRATLSLQGTVLKAFYNMQEAKGRAEDLPEHARRALRQRRPVTAELLVERGGNGWSIVDVRKVDF